MYKYILSALLLIFPFGVSFADLTVSTPDGGNVSVATVNIYNATSTTSKGGVYTLNFDLSNDQGVQPGIKYGVFLTQNMPKGGQVIADQKVYDEVLALSQKETQRRQVTYTPPTSLFGSFDLWVNARNEGGLPLATAYVGRINLPLSTQGVYIDPSSCFLTIKDEKDQPHYNLTQGVDISPAETLLAHCNMINNSTSPQNLIPQFVTHWRTSYGSVVPETGGDTSPISLISKELKSIVVALPKASKPQAYDAQMVLNDSANKAVSNTITFHYVLRGESATVQNAILDKNNYQKGDTAIASFMLSPSADTFPGSRDGVGTQTATTTLVVSIVDINNDACVEPGTYHLTPNQQNPIVRITLPIIKNCMNPHMVTQLKNASGATLDSSSFSLTNTSPVPVGKIPAPSPYLIGFLIVAVAGAIYYEVKNKKAETATNTDTLSNSEIKKD